MGDDIIAKFAVASNARGVLIANNIFHILGRSETVLGDQNRPDIDQAASIANVIFQNNLFLRADNWPKDCVLQEQSPVVGNPEFHNPGGLKQEDYIPRNFSLVKKPGIPIPRLPNDAIGLPG